VEEFAYLGSQIAASGRMDNDVEKRVTQASKAFGALRRAVFLDKDLTLSTKRKVYQGYVLSVLLYGAKCWIPLRKHLKRVEHLPSSVYQDNTGHYQQRAVNHDG